MNEYNTEYFHYGNGSENHIQNMMRNGWHLYSITEVPKLVSSTGDIVVVMFRPLKEESVNITEIDRW